MGRPQRDIIQDVLDYRTKDARILPIVAAYYRIPDGNIKLYLLATLREIWLECVEREVGDVDLEIDRLTDGERDNTL